LSIVNRDLILFGVVILGVGLGIGYLMYEHPEGLNPDWPIWLAALAPALFALGGLHMVSEGLGFPRFSIAMLRLIAVCFWAIVNWAAFFTTHIQCIETVSFLGFEIFDRYPSEMECRNGLRVIIVCVDALIVLPVMVLAWRNLQKRRNKSAK
jgi:hypothetical protein